MRGFAIRDEDAARNSFCNQSLQSGMNSIHLFVALPITNSVRRSAVLIGRHFVCFF